MSDIYDLPGPYSLVFASLVPTRENSTFQLRGSLLNFNR
jgi:hypothetical protein